MIWDIKTAVTTGLVILGSTSRQVEQTLLNLGIQGKRFQSTCCPLANYVSMYLIDAGITDVEILMSPDYCWLFEGKNRQEHVTLSDAVKTFQGDFDENLLDRRLYENT